MLKLTLPNVPGFYTPLSAHKAVIRVVALSGGYSRADACDRLSHNAGIIASFSRALMEDLRITMSDEEFDTSLGKTISEIYTASVVKF
jgi:fructose-bisphosphate aldolase, class I